MSRPALSTGLQQSRGHGYPPSSNQQPLLSAATGIALNSRYPGSASGQQQTDWLATVTSNDPDGQSEWTDNQAQEHARRLAKRAISSIKDQIQELCSSEQMDIGRLIDVFKLLKSARSAGHFSLLHGHQETSVYRALGLALLALVVKFSRELGGRLDLELFDTEAISKICDGLGAAIGGNRDESLFDEDRAAKLREPLAKIIDRLMQRALACGLPNGNRRVQEMLGILTLLSRCMKRWVRGNAHSPTKEALLSSQSVPIRHFFRAALLSIRDWPASTDEKVGNLSASHMLDTRQLGKVMVALNSMLKFRLIDLDDDIEPGLTGRQLLGQCALGLCGGMALDEFRLWRSKQETASLHGAEKAVLEKAEVSAVVVSNISNTIKDFLEAGLISTKHSSLPAIADKLVRWMQVTVRNGEATPQSQSFSNFANFLRAIAEPGLKGQPIPVEDVVSYDALCRNVLERCVHVLPASSVDDGDIQHLANLVSFVKAMARRARLDGYLFRDAASSLVAAISPHAGKARQPESFSQLLAGSVYFMQSGVLPKQTVQPLVEVFITEGPTLVRPDWPALTRKQMLLAATGWLAATQAEPSGDTAHANVPAILAALLVCYKPGDESLPYLKALSMIGERYPANLVDYLPLLSMLTNRTLTLAEARSVIAQTINRIGDEPAVTVLDVAAPPRSSAQAPDSGTVGQPARFGSVNWQPIGSILAKPADAPAERVDPKVRPKKPLRKNYEPMPSTMPAMIGRPSWASIIKPADTASAEGVSGEGLQSFNGTRNILNNTTITTTNTATTTTTNTATATSTITAQIPASISHPATDTGSLTFKDKSSPFPRAGESTSKPAKSKQKNAGKPQKKNSPVSPTPKLATKDEWKHQFSASSKDSVKEIEALLVQQPNLLTMNLGSGANAQPALFHALSLGQPNKVHYLLAQMEQKNIPLNVDIALKWMGQIFSEPRLIGTEHKQAMDLFIRACDKALPEWNKKFQTYLQQQASGIPVAYGLHAGLLNTVITKEVFNVTLTLNSQDMRQIEEWYLGIQELPLLMSLMNGDQALDPHGICESVIAKMFDALASGDVGMVERLITFPSAGKFSEVTSPAGETMLTCAARAGHPAVVDVLLKSKWAAALVAKTNHQNQNAFWCATTHGQLAVTQLMLNSEWADELLSQKGLGNVNALDHAAITGQTGIVKILLASKWSGMLMKQKRELGFNPLFCAVSAGAIPVMQVLLESTWANQLIRGQVTACGNVLMLAASRGQVAALEFLLQSRWAEELISGQYPIKQNALMQAAMHGHQAVVTALLKTRWAAQLISAKNDVGLTAEAFAFNSGHFAIAQQIREHG